MTMNKFDRACREVERQIDEVAAGYVRNGARPMDALRMAEEVVREERRRAHEDGLKVQETQP